MSALAQIIAGTKQPVTPWTAAPACNLLRQRLVSVALKQPVDPYRSGAALLWMAQGSVCFNLLDGLDPSVREPIDPITRSVYLLPTQTVIRAAGDYSVYVPAALAELTNLSVPEAYIRYLRPHALSNNAVIRLPGTIVLVALAGIFLNNLPLVVPVNSVDVVPDAIVDQSSNTITELGGGPVIT